jgi:hypothetical protein
MHAPGLTIFSVQDDTRGKFNVVSFISPSVVANRGTPSAAIVGTLPSNVLKIDPETLKPNPYFVRFLHWVIAIHGPLAPSLMSAAHQLGNGTLLVTDGRVATTGQHKPEDILGRFRLDQGRIVADSYRPHLDYLVVTQNGLFVLEPWLHARLLEEISRL